MESHATVRSFRGLWSIAFVVCYLLVLVPFPGGCGPGTVSPEPNEGAEQPVSSAENLKEMSPEVGQEALQEPVVPREQPTTPGEKPTPMPDAAPEKTPEPPMPTENLREPQGEPSTPPDVIPESPVEPSPPAQAIYVSPTGNDSASGTRQQPVKSFAKAFQLHKAGWEIRLFGGTYQEQLLVNKSGTANQWVRILPVAGEKPIVDMKGQSRGKNLLVQGNYVYVEGITFRNSENQCVDLAGDHITVKRLIVHDCVSHGLQVRGKDVRVEESIIFHTVRENEKKNTNSGWGSGLKLYIGAENVVLYRNRVYHNWGEGIAATRAKHVEITQNLVYDNFSVNLYIDNSIDVLAQQNLVTCKPNSGFERNGTAASGIAIGEEQYQGWGAQLSDITIRNNIVAYCNRGLITYEADVPNGGLQRVSITHNTFWGSANTALSFAKEPFKTKDSVVANNLIQQPQGKLIYVEDPTGISFSNNFWVGNKLPEDWTNGRGTNDLNGDPLLAFQPDYTARSFRISATSPVRDKAKDSPVTADFEGRSRKTTASPKADIGAMEFGPPQDPSAFDDFWTQLPPP